LLIKIPEKDREKVKINKEHEKFEWMNYETAMKKINIKANRELLEKAYSFIKEYEKQKKLI
jgi:hypothetical protein